MTRDLTFEHLHAAFPAVAREMLPPMLNLLVLGRQAIGGDFDKVLIMMVVGVRTAEDPQFARLSQEDLISGRFPVFPGLGVNARSISESLGIPRETVRRKVRELVDEGLLARRGNTLYFTETGFRRLLGAGETLERLAVAYYEIVARLLAKGARPFEGEQSGLSRGHEHRRGP